MAELKCKSWTDKEGNTRGEVTGFVNEQHAGNYCSNLKAQGYRKAIALRHFANAYVLWLK